MRHFAALRAWSLSFLIYVKTEIVIPANAGIQIFERKKERNATLALLGS